MPFTLEQIRKALTPYRTDYFEKLGVNAIAVADYLTGKTATLQPLIHMYDNSIFFFLTTLLHKKSAWNEDDEMIINVFNDPLLLQEAYTLMAKLRDLKLDITKPGDAAEIMFIMNKISLSPQRKFEILYNYFYGSMDEAEGNEVLAYIGNYLRKADNNEISDLINRVRSSHYAEGKFLLFLRMFRPDRYDDYALPKLVRQEGTIDNAVAYDMLLLNAAKYGPIIYKAIRNQEANKIHLRKNLDPVIYLYNANPSEYYSLMIEACEQYVEYFRQVTDFWEQNAFLTGDRDQDQIYPFSGYALYQLVLQNRENGLEKAKQFIKAKGYMNARTMQLLKQVLGEEVLPFILQSLRTEDEYVSKDYHASILPLLKEFEPSLFLDQLWEAVNHKNKSIRETIGRELCTFDPGIKTKAIALLDHKKAEQRQLGAYILSYIGEPDTIAALQQAADTETNDDARDIMLQSMSPDTFQYKSLEDVKKVIDIAARRGKLKKPSIKWLQTDLPSLYLNDGSEATAEFVNFLFYRMGRVKEMRSDIEVRDALKFIDREKSSAFAKKIINLFFDNKAEAKNKHILALGALAGDDEVVDKLRISIVNFIDDGRVKMAEAAVGALALQGSDKALRWVEFFSRKYRNKKANVGAAAQQALENAAEELGITTHELGDRIVPDFGFDGLFRHFTIEGEEYRAFIDSNFKIAFFNADDKKIKSIPAAAPAELKDEFKAVAKEVRDIVKSQSSRLEYYLIVQRKWTYAQWQKFFLSNPVMFIYATKLLWGVYENGELKQAFLCNEDTSLTDINNDEITLDENAIIGIVHPTQLEPADLEAWKKQFFDLSIESEFPQLERKIPDLSDIDMNKAIIRKFQDKQMAQGSIRSTLERYGWFKGPTGDGGYINDFHLIHPEEKLEAILEVEGVGVGYGWGSAEKLHHLYIIDKKKQTSGKWYNSPRNDEEEWLVKLKNAPPIFMNEMLAAVEAIKPAGDGK